MAKEKNEKIEKLVHGFSEVLDSLGNYLVTLGTVEKTDTEFRKLIYQIKRDPQKLTMIIEALPKELSHKILNLFLRMVILSNRVDRVSDLPPKEKIEIGRELKLIGSEFEKIIDSLKKLKSKKKG